MPPPPPPPPPPHPRLTPANKLSWSIVYYKPHDMLGGLVTSSQVNYHIVLYHKTVYSTYYCSFHSLSAP